MTKAGFWARFVALLIDTVIVALFTAPAWIALWTGDRRVERCSVDPSGEFDPTGTVQNGWCEVPSGATWAIFAALLVLAFVGTLAYWAALEGRSGQSVGSRALAIRVVDATTGEPIGGGRAIGRGFARILSMLPCYVGYRWMLGDPHRQTWHDKIVGSVVVEA